MVNRPIRNDEKHERTRKITGKDFLIKQKTKIKIKIYKKKEFENFSKIFQKNKKKFVQSEKLKNEKFFSEKTFYIRVRKNQHF